MTRLCENHNLEGAGMSFDWQPASAPQQSVKGDSKTAPPRLRRVTLIKCALAPRMMESRGTLCLGWQSVPSTVNDRRT